jgi:DNA polymerase V
VMERMVYELRGTPCIDFEQVTPDRKSIMASRSFGRTVTSLGELEEAVATHTARAAEKMRRQDLATACVVVFVHTNRFKPDAPQYYGTKAMGLPVATADTGKLIAAIWRNGYGYSKAGVIFPTLVPASQVQSDLFALPDSDGRKALMRTLDGLNRRYGRGAVTYGTMGRQQRWKLRSDHLSKHYTTDWEQLLSV